MVSLYHEHFISKEETVAVTGLIPGGKCGKLKNRDGTIKFTRAIDSNELFVKQSVPYVYPLFKVHKIQFNEINEIQPNEVSNKIPSRMVVGIKSCQLSSLQA